MVQILFLLEYVGAECACTPFAVHHWVSTVVGHDYLVIIYSFHVKHVHFLDECSHPIVFQISLA